MQERKMYSQQLKIINVPYPSWIIASVASLAGINGFDRNFIHMYIDVFINPYRKYRSYKTDNIRSTSKSLPNSFQTVCETCCLVIFIIYQDGFWFFFFIYDPRKVLPKKISRMSCVRDFKERLKVSVY